MRIHIMGGSGSGKSFIAEKLSTKYNLKIYDLDKLEWNGTFNKKALLEDKKKNLEKILKEDNIIIEGVYFDWVESSLKKVDYIFYINVPYKVQRNRILKRSLFRKIGIYKCQFKESIKSINDLIKWNKKYNTILQPQIRKVLEPYKNKVYNVKKYEEIIKILEVKK